MTAAMFRYFSASVRVTHHASGLATVAYSGPMTCKSFQHLRNLAIVELVGAEAILSDMRACVMLESLESCSCGPYVGANPPGAILVNAEQLDAWASYSARAAQDGVCRAVFTCAAAALAWAEGRLKGPSARRARLVSGKPGSLSAA